MKLTISTNDPHEGEQLRRLGFVARPHLKAYVEDTTFYDWPLPIQRIQLQPVADVLTDDVAPSR